MPTATTLLALTARAVGVTVRTRCCRWKARGLRGDLVGREGEIVRGCRRWRFVASGTCSRRVRWGIGTSTLRRCVSRSSLGVERCRLHRARRGCGFGLLGFGSRRLRRASVPCAGRGVSCQQVGGMCAGIRLAVTRCRFDDCGSVSAHVGFVRRVCAGCWCGNAERERLRWDFDDRFDRRESVGTLTCNRLVVRRIGLVGRGGFFRGLSCRGTPGCRRPPGCGGRHLSEHLSERIESGGGGDEPRVAIRPCHRSRLRIGRQGARRNCVSADSFTHVHSSPRSSAGWGCRDAGR